MHASATGPRFDAGIAPGGYAWWYVDAVSHDGRHGLTIIALLGSVFSPYYARARRRDPGIAPLEHSALNVALYGAAGHRWAMTERRAADVRRDARSLRIGPSALAWDGEHLMIAIDEVTVPLPGRLRGSLRLRPHALHGERHALDAAGRHRWQPIAPRASVEVVMERPGLSWQGDAYFDSNDGDRGLEDDFETWTWSRTAGGDETAVFYDVERSDGGKTQLALAYDVAGGSRRVDAPPPASLCRTPWGIERPTRSDAGQAPRVLATLEDGPFYARSDVELVLGGARRRAIHESVSLQRFRQAWVRSLLPFKMPRVPAWLGSRERPQAAGTIARTPNAAP